MREIKFRAWYDGVMYVVYELSFHAQGIREAHMESIEVRARYHTSTLSKIELMQFTGLHDKNGKEIYEGDIVLRYGKHAFAVAWDGNVCGFRPLCDHRNDYGRANAEESSRLTEVIGNIYENPDLLTKL